jgi:hypothetical protein
MLTSDFWLPDRQVLEWHLVWHARWHSSGDTFLHTCTSSLIDFSKKGQVSIFIESIQYVKRVCFSLLHGIHEMPETKPTWLGYWCWSLCSCELGFFVISNWLCWQCQLQRSFANSHPIPQVCRVSQVNYFSSLYVVVNLVFFVISNWLCWQCQLWRSFANSHPIPQVCRVSPSQLLFKASDKNVNFSIQYEANCHVIHILI